MVNNSLCIVISIPPFVISIPPSCHLERSREISRSLHALRLVEMTWGLRLIVGYVVIIVAATTAGITSA